MGTKKPGPDAEPMRAALCQIAKRDWNDLITIAGEKLQHYTWHVTPRLKLHNDNRDILRTDAFEDVLWNAELYFRTGLCSQGDQPLEPYFQQYYSLYMMAVDESAALERKAPPLLTAAWTVARSAGYCWWPFPGVVILSERPVEIHFNEKFRLHREDGPAAVFRDGSRVWAWNGCPLQKEWIFHPEKIPRAELRQLDPTFRQYAETRVGAPKLKLSTILKRALPTASEKRVSLLKRHNRGSLQRFKRYKAGEHKKVWEELIALGPSVREDPHAADALAVAYETMRRVRENVRTVTARLKALGYDFGMERPLELPSAKSRKQIASLEKLVEGIPLSLRAFYDVVGGVNWTGNHPAIAPDDPSIEADPLVVEAVGTALEYCEDGEDEDQVYIAPDGATKAGGRWDSSYVILVPNLGADGKLANEFHDVYFVEYLRVAFHCGGFPGYDGIDDSPPELENLSEGLLEF